MFHDHEPHPLSVALCLLPSVCCPLSVVQSSKSPARAFCLTGPLALNALNALNALKILIALDAMPPGARQSNADETLKFITQQNLNVSENAGLRLRKYYAM